MLLQHAINGLVLGSVYALIAVGFSLVFSVLEIINFSHGAMLMLGAYFGLVLIGALGLGLPARRWPPARCSWRSPAPSSSARRSRPSAVGSPPGCSR